jgi:DNA-directed RNA polymerase subunit F
MKIIEKQEIPDAEAKLVLEERKKQGELVYEQKICLDFLEKAVKMKKAELEDMKKQLSEIEILKPRHIALLINNMPTTEDEVKQIFAKERTNLKKEEISKIIEIFK